MSMDFWMTRILAVGVSFSSFAYWMASGAQNIRPLKLGLASSALLGIIEFTSSSTWNKIKG